MCEVKKLKITFTDILFSLPRHTTLLDQITMAKNNNSSTNTDEKKPVSNEDRRTHTNSEHDVETTESTKHNADKVSCSSTATIARSRQEESESKSSDNVCENYRVLVETESWRTAKNWKSDQNSFTLRVDQGNYPFPILFSHGLPSLMFYIRRVQVLFNVSRGSRTCLRSNDRNLRHRCGSLPRLLFVRLLHHKGRCSIRSNMEMRK